MYPLRYLISMLCTNTKTSTSETSMVAFPTIDQMARTMRIHARLGNHFFYHSCRHASYYALNRLCPKVCRTNTVFQPHHIIKLSTANQGSATCACLDVWTPRRFPPPRSTIARPPNSQEATNSKIYRPRHLPWFPSEASRTSHISGRPHRHDAHHGLTRPASGGVAVSRRLVCRGSNSQSKRHRSALRVGIGGGQGTAALHGGDT